ncbi:MCP four helix bundle domain-containing protein [Pseudomonas salmasensis]|uniref:MCP four helix bundle domain-containing protein n=1 Tax=Pseudomonas salmasensis TaxID=2745514 RepID=UPI003D28B4E2
MNIRSLNIAPRAGLGFGVLALMVFVLGGFALLQMANMRQQSDQVETNWLPSVMAVGEMNQDVLRIRALTLRLLVNRDPPGGGAERAENRRDQNRFAPR